MIKYLLYLLLCFVGLNALAQKDFRFRNYTISEGLSQSSVTTIVQDNLNTLWVGTQDGLNRYDGKRFEVFTSDKTEGIESEYIKCSAVDEVGNLWFGTTNGLTTYNLYSETFETFHISKGKTFQIESISIGNNDLIWVATAENGLYLFEIKTSKFQSLNKYVKSRKTTKVQHIRDQLIAVATQDQGLIIFDFASKSIKQHNISPEINQLIVRSEDELLIATKQGVFQLNFNTNKLNKRFSEYTGENGFGNVVDVYQQNEVGWLVATKSSGLFVLTEDNELEHYSEDIFQNTALLSDELNVLFKDNTGGFWLGSQRGLSYFDPMSKGFLGIGPSGNAEKGIPSPTVWSFTESNDQRFLYVGTNKAISQYDRKKGIFRQFYREKSQNSDPTDEMTILSIEPVTENKLLVGCVDGLFILTFNESNYNYSRVYLPADLERKHDRVYSIVNWNEDQYFIATKGGALLFDIKTGKAIAFEHDSKTPKHTISKGVCRLVYKDRNGTVWLTTSTGGLNTVIKKGEKIIIQPYAKNETIISKSADYITTIYDDDDGNYWFGTIGSGVVKWNPKSGKAEQFSKIDGLPNDVVYGILPDDDGNLWMSTNKGLAVFNPSSNTIKSYKESSGLLSDEFNLGAYFKSKSGLLYFGGIYGYNYFKPQNLHQADPDIRIVFTKFKQENEWLKPNSEGSPLKKPIFLTDEINLSYHNRSFTLKFQPSSLTDAEQINYKYLLEGSDHGEILIGSNDEIRFDALASGSYTLKIFARYGEGQWSSYPATMKINISPPFWSTWWFWLIIVASAVIGVRIFIRQRIDAAARERVRLEMKIRERTKEIQSQNEKIERQKLKIEKEKNKVVEQQRLLQIEKDKAEKLLKNIIPESTAEELKKRGKARARAYKTVSVLFTDFVGFTKISDRMNPTELVKKLDVYFTEFDKIIVRNNLEKIKTIGDAYMCAGGVPVRNSSNPIDTCLAAVQIQDYMLRRKNDAIANDKEYWDLRLGINTGEVTAGVIGSERLAYDIWGATVNQAQRMEMLGEPGKVTITGATFEHIEPYFECTFKGKAQSKSRGLIDMYIVEGIKPELSVNGEGIFPNERFNQIVNLHLYSSINYYKAERHIMRLLNQHLSKALHYHSIGHTKDVVKAVERLALLENVTDEGLFLLKSAATYHDAGFIEQYDKNEPIGARLAQEILPKYGYTDKHINQIKDLIYVTAIPHKPKNLLEEIICDADLDYLGRDDFHEIADRLRRELREHGKIDSDRKWDEIQVSFLNSHKYFTKTAKDTRDKKKAQNLQEILDRLERDQYKD